MVLNFALKVHDCDNVATVVSNGVEKKASVEVYDKKGNKSVVTVHEPVPFGHKVAVEPIACGARIIKYGEEIGVATQNIDRGDYVHVHNLDSMRGRGDL